MWKESIECIKRRFWQWDFFRLPVWVGDSLYLLEQTSDWPGVGDLSMRLSDTNLIKDMVVVEQAAYQGLLPWDARDLLYDMTQNKDAFYIQALVDYNLVAFIGLRRDLRDVHISNLVVLPEYQSQSIGHRLLEQAVHCAKLLDRQSLSLEVRASNYGAQRFYRRHGFNFGASKSNYYLDNHEDAIIMTLEWEQSDED
ncbi:ribosomal protein S18-alanine N-acetyltransferase [Aerococcus kribbianus]|uniref:Ribosomal protein S18-alanine N-acetyltransferase n=1 Tax=Aerococcus kribbianus TaxID=2999064 RepID=A0A9X3FV49_9LACT|nr:MULTISPECIES: ribosomal protein S18-alanine N-acetyltransferase [unclassified Aerococcus]MCZ0717521.1 ribosomal protein S18-alanine N-acetyltransferase [Aerococcus sp. YH-aer221]MCZ0725809.1 ribosomal protein S18-alanine N-acetyltransferase [Aerococcus sp. YH-aer222]